MALKNCKGEELYCKSFMVTVNLTKKISCLFIFDLWLKVRRCELQSVLKLILHGLYLIYTKFKDKLQY